MKVALGPYNEQVRRLRLHSTTLLLVGVSTYVAAGFWLLIVALILMDPHLEAEEPLYWDLLLLFSFFALFLGLVGTLLMIPGILKRFSLRRLRDVAAYIQYHGEMSDPSKLGLTNLQVQKVISQGILRPQERSPLINESYQEVSLLEQTPEFTTTLVRHVRTSQLFLMRTYHFTENATPAAIELKTGKVVDVTQHEHPGLIPLFDTDLNHRGERFFVMATLDGETIAARIHREGTVSWQQVVAHGLELTDALRIAHESGITHGNIDSETIFLVTTLDGGSHAALLPFHWGASNSGEDAEKAEDVNQVLKVMTLMIGSSVIPRALGDFLRRTASEPRHDWPTMENLHAELTVINGENSG